jgi:membrane-associated phospholipid phosphatase
VAFAIVLAHASIRGLGDQFRGVSSVHDLERALFGGTVPTSWLQDRVQSHDFVWVDFLGFLAHAAWFISPWLLAFTVMVARRDRLLELFAWMVAVMYVASAVFLVFPVEPPWMEIGSVRVLEERQFIHYVGADNNPVAAMPSLHAALPFALGIFCLSRLGWRKAGFGFLAYSGVVGFFVVYLGEHWVVDVLAGYALSGCVAVAFTTPAVEGLADALPGHPVTAFRRFNEFWFPRGRATGEVLPDRTEERIAA